MAFVKLDCGILNSTLWVERECREVFITALLMAEPFEVTEPLDQLKVSSLEKTGWIVPPGWYGFIPAAGPGIVRRAIMEQEAGLAALARLGEPDPASRSQDFEGRRLIRVDGGFIVLNYMKYRDKDHSAAARSKRYREKKKLSTATRDATSELVTRDDGMTKSRNITQAYAEAEAYNPKSEHAREDGPVDKSKPTKLQPMWWSSDQGIALAAQALGIEARRGESFGDLKARVNARLETTQGT